MTVIDTIAAGTRITHEIEIKKSRFITTLARTDSPDEARVLIDGVKAANPQARHNCSAYLVLAEGLNPQQHSSDDGEPSGTAGTPMLEALRRGGAWNVTAVVTRYFGGILLGGGGLIRAYSSSVSQTLALAPRVRLIDLDILETELDVADAGRVEAELRAAGAQVLGAEWGTRVRLRIGVDEGGRDPFDVLLAERTAGVARFHVVGTTRFEIGAPVG